MRTGKSRFRARRARTFGFVAAFFLTVGFARVAPAGDAALSKLVTALDSTQGIEDLKGDVKIVPEGPNNEKVLLADCAQQGFSGRIDLQALGVCRSKAVDASEKSR
jgi:hypothetical protein